jgi:hypothetical protein
MKKLVLMLAVLLLAAPAMATDVTITAVAGPGPNDVTVGFTTSSVTELVRAIALDVIVNDANVVIADINCVNADYGIYPGSISIDASGNVTNWGTCAGAGLDSNTVATEQGSLYADGDPAPDQSGDLFIITLDGCTQNVSGDVVVSITEDALRGGIVLEDPAVAAGVTLPSDVTVTITAICDQGPSCPCLGDVDDSGSVNFGDLSAIYGAMVTAYPSGDPTFSYDIGLPAGLECGDLDGNGTIDFADLSTMYGAMVSAYPSGDPTFSYEIGCPF